MDPTDAGTYAVDESSEITAEALEKMLASFAHRTRGPEIRASKYMPRFDKDGEPCAFLIDLNEAYRGIFYNSDFLHRAEMRRKPWWDGTVILVHPDWLAAAKKKGEGGSLLLFPREVKKSVELGGKSAD